MLLWEEEGPMQAVVLAHRDQTQPPHRSGKPGPCCSGLTGTGPPGRQLNGAEGGQKEVGPVG